MNIEGGFIAYESHGKMTTLKFSMDSEMSNGDLRTASKLKGEGNSSIFTLEIIPKGQVVIKELYLEVSMKFNKNDKVFLNGFQTWTESREFEPDENIPKLRGPAWPIMSQYGDYTIYNSTGKRGILHSFTYTYLNREDQYYTLLASLDEAEGYTIFEYDFNRGVIKIIKDCSNHIINSPYKAFNLLITTGNQENIFQSYFEQMRIAKPEVKPCTGWTSWYNYYTGITQDIILENLNAFSKNKIPINTFQIDDGYQNAVGDWLIINNKFPRGMKYLADKIKSRGYRAGLWLAPFVCEKKSNIFKNNPDWVLRDEKGKMVTAGFNPGWSGIFYVLDFYNEDFRKYLRKVFDTVLNEWGYDMVKLDFLYAVALLPRREKTRGGVMSEAMEFLRELVGDKIILGCGVPLGPSFGLVDYCRIGSDVALKWEDGLLNTLNYRERVSTINSLTSTIGRSGLNGRAFNNDPDVFILRSVNNKLTKEQRSTLFVLNQVLGGLVFTSDNLNEYTKGERREYLSQFPFKEKRIKRVVKKDMHEIYFEIDGLNYILLANLEDKTAHFEMENGIYFNAAHGFIKGGKEITILPYTSLCLLKLRESKFEIAGSTCHLFPGSEIINFVVHEESINFDVHKDLRVKGEIYVKIPEQNNSYKINGVYCKSEKLEGLNIVKISVGDEKNE